MSDPIRILVAEDHLVARVGVSTIVNMQPDMTVVAEASNGQQAVELYRKHLPDVTLLDLRMPGMGGVEAAAAIRAEFPNARLIALTTYGGDEISAAPWRRECRPISPRTSCTMSS